MLPEELNRSAPRKLELTSLGHAAIAAMIALVIGAILSGILVYQRVVSDQAPVRLLASEGRTTVGRAVDIKRRRGENQRVILRYSYVVDGREYTGETRLKKSDRNLYRLGSELRVRYLASKPAESWMEGYRPRNTPYWLIVALPAGLLLCIVPIILTIRRQSRLVADGRAALARVTKAHKVSYGEHSGWRIHYEWTSLSGAMRTGLVDKYKRPPAIGSTIPILYDRDNPRRHSPYPMSLVRATKR